MKSAIVIARSETTKQSLFIDEIATLPSVARNDKGGYDTASFGRTPEPCIYRATARVAPTRLCAKAHSLPGKVGLRGAN
jgi:hypothetical protein